MEESLYDNIIDLDLDLNQLFLLENTNNNPTNNNGVNFCIEDNNPISLNQFNVNSTPVMNNNNSNSNTLFPNMTTIPTNIQQSNSNLPQITIKREPMSPHPSYVDRIQRSNSKACHEQIRPYQSPLTSPGTVLNSPGTSTLSPSMTTNVDGSRVFTSNGAVVVDESKIKRMLRNRESAEKSRQKRKERVDELEAELPSLNTQYANALMDVAKLEAENDALKEELEAMNKIIRESPFLSQLLNTVAQVSAVVFLHNLAVATQAQVVRSQTPPISVQRPIQLVSQTM